MTPRTQVVVPGDGANGLREAVVAVFPGAQDILDHPHLKSHFYDTADALGLEEPERHQWVKGYMDQLWACEVDGVRVQSVVFKAHDRHMSLLSMSCCFRQQHENGC